MVGDLDSGGCLLVIRLFLTMVVSCYGCLSTMQVLDAHTALGMQMLEFLDVPLYWKFMMVTGWNGSINGLTEDVDVPKYRWFLPPNCEQVRLSTDLDGISIIYLLRGERDAGGVMHMIMKGGLVQGSLLMKLLNLVVVDLPQSSQ